MFRKLILAAGATIAIAAAVVSVPTAASAGWHGHHGHGYRLHSSFAVGFYVPTVVAVPECYVVRRLVLTPRGERWRFVTVCG